MDLTSEFMGGLLTGWGEHGRKIIQTGQWFLACHLGANTQYHHCVTSHPHQEFHACNHEQKRISISFLFFSFLLKIALFLKVPTNGIPQKEKGNIVEPKKTTIMKPTKHSLGIFHMKMLGSKKQRKKKKRVGKSIQRRRKELTFESHLWSSLWRLLDHAHKSLPVGMVCHQMNTPSLAHPQALPLHTIIRTHRWAILLYPKLESETIPICHQKPSINTGKKKHSALIARNESIKISITNKPIWRESLSVD